MANAVPRQLSLKRKKIFTASNTMLYLMILPAIVSYTIFHYIPLPGVVLAFADFRLSGFKGWVGFDHFEYIFRLNYFWYAFRNTWYFVLLRYLFVFPSPIIFALLINELRLKYYKKTVQTISTMPHFISWVVIAGIFMNLLSPSVGYVNFIIEFLGGEPVYFLAKEKLFPWLFTFMRIWKEVGYSAIIYIAALSGIDPQLYEAAIIDGAGRLKQTWHVTLPGLKTTILVLFVLSFAHVMGGMFEPIYVFKNPMIQNTAEILDTYTYEIGVVKANYSVATAIGLFKSSISLVLVLASNYLSKRVTEDGRPIL